MARETIDFGIDLGTTNSAIAVAAGHDATVVRNNLRGEFTPSAVHVTKSGKTFVGVRARNTIEDDPDNTCTEFKLKMGDTAWQKEFARSGRTMSAPELSAVVLRSLRGDVSTNVGEDIEAAVITVPAAFELDQCEATRQAAALAGLSFAPLLQEPTAAAWAYSARAADDRTYWLVYDFGGGTFDAAVLSVRDGEFTVVNHAGNNFLGGKLIDWAIVENVLVPAARDLPGLRGLARGKPEWRGVIAKLKMAAEEAKIALSSDDAVDVEVDFEVDGEEVNFAYELTRAEVDRQAAPHYAKSIALCRQALQEKNLGPGDIERVLLVGGATLSPTLRELLKDPAEGLGIRLDHSLDPVTVVAQGAAIFASTQRMPRGTTQAAAPGQVLLELEGDPVGSDTEPLVGGRAKSEPARDWTGYTIEFVNEQAQPAWHSGQIPLSADGAFATRLRAQERRSNTYTISLRDPKGTLVQTDPATRGYRHAPLRGGNPVLSHSVGVGLDDNSVDWLLTKNTELPARKRTILNTVLDVRRAERSGLIRVPIVEGEQPRVDRNTTVGRLDILPHEVKRDVPAGSEIEVTVHVDESFQVRADAYVPLLDEEFPIEVRLGRVVVDAAILRKEASDVGDRLAALTAQATEVNATDVLATLSRLESSGRIDEINSLAASAEVDADAAATCQTRLREAQATLDEAEHALLLPKLIRDSEAIRESVGRMVRESGDPGYRQQLTEAEEALDRAIAARDYTVIERQVDVIRGIGFQVLQDNGQLDAVLFGIYEEELADNPDPQVQRLLNEGRAAANTGDQRGLAVITNQLRQLAPDDTPIDPLSVISTVRKGGRAR